MSDESIDEKVSSALGSMVRNTASMIGAIGIIGTAIWWTFGQGIDTYFETKINTAINPIKKDLARIKSFQDTSTKPFIEFQGRGIVKPNTKIKAGGTVTITYSLKRSRACTTSVLVQFYSLDKQRVDTSLTSTIPATPSRKSEEFNDFSIDVKIPKNAKPGFYSYRPILTPEISCGKPRRVPFSDYFEVIE
jgi:hypothetical protein